MAINTKLLFLLSVLLLSATFSLTTGENDEWSIESDRRDPWKERQECQEKCTRQQGREQQQCQKQCDEKYKERQHGGRGDSDIFNTREKEDPQRELQRCQEHCRSQQQGRSCVEDCQKRFEEQQREHGRGGVLNGADAEEDIPGERQDPRLELQQCQEQCQSRREQGREEQRRCQERCWKRFEEQQREQGRGGRGRQGEESEWGEQDHHRQGEHEGESRGQQGREEEEENPFLFRLERFSSRAKSEEGNIRVLERFNRRSKLLKGIENYRVSLIEANPNTFMVPSHWDADCICVVLNGRGSITLIRQDNKETHNLRQGDIFKTRAGTSFYKVNRDNNEKLYILALEIPVNIPGQFEAFFPTGGRDQDSFFNAFSDEILQAAFNTPADQLKKMFQGQNKGVFVKASQEQIKALTGDSSEHGVWPFHKGGESRAKRPYNIFENGPAQSNKFGRLFEAKPSDYEELQDNDVAVSYANITRGGMIGPYYNSRSTKIAMVTSGDGYYEMACPHMSQQQGQQGRGRGRGSSPQRGSSSYQKIRARVSRGDVFIVPAGHPIVTVASTNQNLQVVCFEINAENNRRYPLAGNNNILKQLEKEAKELSFNIPAKQVEEILNKQEESWFFAGPRQQRGGGYASA